MHVPVYDVEKITNVENTRDLMEILPLTKALQQDWDALVYHSDEGGMFHLYDFLIHIVQDTWKYPSHHFLIRNKGKIVAICPVFVQEHKRRILPSRYFMNFGAAGPALHRDLPHAEKLAVLRFLFVHIAALAKKERMDHFSFNIYPFSKIGLRERKPLISQLPFIVDHSGYTYIVNLQQPIENIYRSFEKRCRNSIMRAEKERITIIEAKSLEDIREYYAMHRETYQRTGAKHHPFAYFKNIWQIFGKTGMVHFFIAKKEGAPIAAINVALFQQNSLYWTGCSKTAYLSTGVNNLLQWHAIQWAKTQGGSYYDLGEAFPDATGKLKGLNDFKGSFGGTMHPFYKFTIVYRPFKTHTLTLLKNVRDRYWGR